MCSFREIWPWITKVCFANRLTNKCNLYVSLFFAFTVFCYGLLLRTKASVAESLKYFTLRFQVTLNDIWWLLVQFNFIYIYYWIFIYSISHSITLCSSILPSKEHCLLVVCIKETTCPLMLTFIHFIFQFNSHVWLM